MTDSADSSQEKPVDLRKLLRAINDSFSIDDLRDLCFELQLDFENLPGSAKKDKARELIIHFDRRKRINVLVATFCELRPNVDFESIVLDEMDALLDRIPAKIEARAEDIEDLATRVVLGFVENLDVYNMVMSNMMSYDEGKLEALIKNSSNEQLNYIKYLGGALGVLGGLVIWQPVPAVILFSGMGAILFVVDEALFRLRKKSQDAG